MIIRNALCGIVCASSVLCARVTVRPEGPVVVSVGSSLQFHANGNVTWSLEPGSIGEIDRDGVYHAPQSISVKNSAGGCQILPNDHVFNTRVDSLPVDPQSAYYISLIPPVRVGYYEGWGANVSDQSTPRKQMHLFYTPHHDGVYDLVQWPEVNRETGALTSPHSGEDRHEVTVNRDSCKVFELYNVYEAGQNPSCPTCTAQSGFEYSDMEYKLPVGSVDAAGLMLQPLTLGLAEIRSGAVQHALRVTLRNSIISPTSVWPSHSHAGAWGHVPYGTRFRLKSSYDISKFSETSQILLRQLQQYGFFVADGGADWAVSTSTDLTLDPVVMAALDEIAHKGPTAKDFEAVDESSLIASQDSGMVKPDNGHVKPDSFAVVVATDSHGNASRTRVLVRGVTIGVPQPSVWIQSGVTQQLTAWMSGEENKGLRWALKSGPGSITPDGRYTGPEVTRPTEATVTVSSVADPNTKADVVVTVMPPGPIRVDVGNASGAKGTPNRFAPDYGPDSEGHMWWRGQAGEMSWGMPRDDWGVKWPQGKDISLYYTARYSLGDMIYRFFVPDGRYKITLLFAQNGEGGKADTYPPLYRAPIDLEAQSKILVNDYDMGAGIDHATRTPVTESLPAEVTNQSLYFALRRLSVPGSHIQPSPMLNAYRIERDESPPHVAIIPHEVPVLHIKQQIQFKTVGWWMPGTVKWSIQKGGGTITDAGLFTAPSEPPKNDEEIVVEARSTVNPSVVTTVPITMKPGTLSIEPESASIDYSLSQQFHAKLSGIPYENVNWSVTPNLGSMNAEGVYIAPDKVASDTNVTIKAQNKLLPDRFATATVQIKAKVQPIRIICGAMPGFTDAQGNVWSSDNGYSGQTVSYHVSTPIPKARPDLMRIYQTSRYVYDNGKFSYNFAVPNGRYKVVLLFCDYGYDTPGHHFFDVKLNGDQVLTNFDPNAVYGTRAAVDKEFDVNVQDKAVNIDFIAHKGGALINGIEIIPLS